MKNTNIVVVKLHLSISFLLCHDQVSALVTLYSHLGDVNTAVEVLDDAVEHAQKNKVSKVDSC